MNTMRRFFISLSFILIGFLVNAQDTTLKIDNGSFTLTDAIVRNNFDYKAILQRIKEDTSFYKAFKTLRTIGYSSYNYIQMRDKNEKVIATLNSKTRQNKIGGCRTMDVLEENVSGNMKDANGDYNYTTPALYASLFFTKGTICGETNIVKGKVRTVSGSGLSKAKDQLKMLFFNPGKDIQGIPLMGNKVQVFDTRRSDLYDFIVDIQEYKGKTAYVFTLKVKEDLSFFKKDEVVIDEMTTWFDYETFEVIERDYKMTYNAGVYRFNVTMHVEIDKVSGMLYPKLIRYDGSWGVLIKGSERGLFTATLYDLSLK